MADKETEQEWAKLRRIEAEKKKARQAIQGEKPDVVGASYLEPQKKKVRGWSTDKELLLKKTEKFGTWSVLLALLGIAMGVIAAAGGIVTEVGRFGMAGMMISGIPGGVGAICLIFAMLFAVIVIVVEGYYRLKDRSKFGNGWWSAIVAAALIALYTFVKWAIAGFH